MLADLTKKAGQLLADNAETILTAGGIIGTVTTAVLTGRATFQAADVISEETDKQSMEASKEADHLVTIELTKTEKVKLVWPLYVAPAATGVATIGSILFARRLSAQNAAALAALYGTSSKQRDEYKAKLEEKLGVKKGEMARSEIHEDRIKQNPPNKTVIIGAGEVLCYDAYSDRYFETSVEKIRQAERAVHKEILDRNECNLTFFYDELGMPGTGVSSDVGWNLHHSCTVNVDTILFEDHKPILAIEFADMPIFEYGVKY